MKFLLDENVTTSIYRYLKSQNYEVMTLIDLKKLGIENGEVAEIALDQNAVIITFDADYLHLKKTIQQNSRIIYISMHKIHPVLARDLMEKNLVFCLQQLQKPGIVIITEDNCIFKNS